MPDDFRVERAQELLKNDLFVEAFEALEAQLKDRWENSGSQEVDAREDCWLALQLLRQVRQSIESIVTTGKLDALGERFGPLT
ncbi:MAG: hypothetical protein QF595_02565 [Dehalococcoidia bacterium]|jgi:hypothetical protein|nr:hypothetical protein [Dehalococcoidia bacterium]|tara:strand:- start:1671 stop:1919 length:249 start_codon:yes stop_codon:yes gene_type:complete